MTSGRSKRDSNGGSLRKDFPIRINRLAISQLANMAPVGKDFMNYIASGAPQEDLQVAAALIALEEYLKARRVQPDFEVVLSE